MSLRGRWFRPGLLPDVIRNEGFSSTSIAEAARRVLRAPEQTLGGERVRDAMFWDGDTTGVTASAVALRKKAALGDDLNAAMDPKAPAHWAGDGNTLNAEETQAALSDDIYYIVPDKCTECVGFHDEPQCAAVCPVDCCVDDEDVRETKEELLAKKEWLHMNE